MAAQSIKIGVRNWLMHPGWCDIDLLTGLGRFNLGGGGGAGLAGFS